MQVLYGPPITQARAAVILVHGRGATGRSMLPLAHELEAPGVAFIAPQAPGGTWYPYPFLAPLEQNEPYLSQALDMLGGLVADLEGAGISAEKILLLGFSQGASLSSTYLASHARRYGGLAMLSGALIGPPGSARNYPGSLAGTPVFLGCSDSDPYIPKESVLESERVLRELGAQVTARLYPGLGHTVNADELDFVRGMVGTMVK